MNRNYIFTDVNHALPALLHELLTHGDEVGSRAGRTMELTHVGITLQRPDQRYLMTPGRKHSIAAQIAETMWVLSGRDDMEFLSNYLPRAKDFSDNGVNWRAGYGARIRHWHQENQNLDQLAYVVDKLKADPLTRQAVISIWDPPIDTLPGKDIPCNDWITFSNRLGRLDMHVGIRSNDAIWGWSGINAFEWSAMLEIVAGLVRVQVGSLHFSTTSFHLYEKHFAKARKIVTDNAAAMKPTLIKAPAFHASRMQSHIVGEGTLAEFDRLAESWFVVEEMIRNGICPDEVVDSFSEPMLQSWLRVLQWWWSGDQKYLDPIKDTSLAESCRQSVQPKRVKVGVSSVTGKSCSCGTPGLDYEGPQRDCDIHGEPGYIVDGDELTKGVSTEGMQTAWNLVRGKVFEGDLRPGKVWETSRRSPFIVESTRLHLEKHEAYGDSWKKRGEMVSILANIARKVDRLGGSETSDETSADTAMDLMIYLAKYRTWLTDAGWGAQKPTTTVYSDDPHWANELLLKTDDDIGGDFDQLEPHLHDFLSKTLKDQFEHLFMLADQGRKRDQQVDSMLRDSYRLARQLWDAENAMTDAASVGGGLPGSWSLDESSKCPKCGSSMSTSGGRTPLKCIAAVCNYTPSKDEETVEEYRGADVD